MGEFRHGSRDRHSFDGSCSVVDRRFDPDQAEVDRLKAADQRHFDISDPTDHGLVHIDGLLDAVDGRDLDEAIAREAHTLGQLGDDSSLDVRRSRAAGVIARRDLTLDLPLVEEGALAPVTRPPQPDAPDRAQQVRRLRGPRDGCCATSSTNGPSWCGR